MSITVAIHEGFLSSYSKLSQVIQNKTQNFIKKLKQNPLDKGINLEKISNPYDDKFYSGRVDLTYRVIMAIQKGTNTYILLWVDHHDEAYEWASKKKMDVNKLTGLLQLYSIVSLTEIVKPVVNKVFDKYTNEQLLSLGVPELQMDFVRSLVTAEDFYNNKSSFSSDVYEFLEFLVNGEDYSNVLELINSENVNETDDLSISLKETQNTRSYFVIEGQEELNKMLEAPLEKWRVFLHPSQSKLVSKNFSGPAKVSGEAGTGKTVVAMHRAKYLLGLGKKVLFTTFTSNLVGDIENNIMKIISLKEAKNLEVRNVDSVIIHYLLSKGKKYRIEYDENELDKYWNEAILFSDIDLALDVAFYREEWRKIATIMDDLSIEKYVSVPRGGRGVRLTRNERLKVWHVFEEYMDLLRKNQCWDIDYATYQARKILSTEPENPYDSIIIDEGQDISVNAYKFLRLYAGVEHQNDLFIVGDPHQRIYKNKAVLSKCGINVKGRSSILRINYRTTEETRKYAFGFLEGINFDDIDSEYSENTKCQSLTHGDNPVICNFSSFEEQIKYVVDEIDKIHNMGTRYEDICIVARNHSQIKLVGEYLNAIMLPFAEINNSKEDNGSDNGVRIATMHRVKGLEFRYVFLISVNKNIIPVTSKNVDMLDNMDNDIIERSLLYVSLTRAQIKAYVLSFGEKSILL